jgi:hypothetical protein
VTGLIAGSCRSVQKLVNDPGGIADAGSTDRLAHPGFRMRCPALFGIEVHMQQLTTCCRTVELNEAVLAFSECSTVASFAIVGSGSRAPIAMPSAMQAPVSAPHVPCSLAMPPPKPDAMSIAVAFSTPHPSVKGSRTDCAQFAWSRKSCSADEYLDMGILHRRLPDGSALEKCEDNQRPSCRVHSHDPWWHFAADAIVQRDSA